MRVHAAWLLRLMLAKAKGNLVLKSRVGRLGALCSRKVGEGSG